MDMLKKIKEFTSFILTDDKKDNDLEMLIRKLDELPLLVYAVDFEFDGNDYPDPPENIYSEIRSKVVAKFPELGMYESTCFDESIERKERLTVGDAIDDITDIVGDLLEIEWYFENTTEANAMWHLETSYRSHWGNHLREVQLYLYRQHY
jgi:hypothetical protein